MKLRYTKTALCQIEEALSYVKAHSPQGMASLRERILAAVTLMQDHPLAGQATSRQGTRRMVLTPFPYVIFYSAVADEIIVTRFRHAARKPLSTAELL